MLQVINRTDVSKSAKRRWAAFWMRIAGLSWIGRTATRLAGAFSPPYKGRRYLAKLNAQGYFAPTAAIHCPHLTTGRNVFVGERVTIHEAGDGEVAFGDRVSIHQDSIIEVGMGGRVIIGADTHVQPRCQLTAYKGSLTIGANVQIGPNCAFYPYNHATAAGRLIQDQPLQTKGGIVLEDDVWLGFGVIVLDGVRIGRGAVVGAGAVVTRDLPENAIAVGAPARVINTRRQSMTSSHVDDI